MVEIFKSRNNLSFAPMQQIYSLIDSKVTDINAVRRAKSTVRERQWIYPSFPDANDENYPRVAIINNGIKFEEYGSSNFVNYLRNSISGDAEHIVYARVAILPISITVFVKKKQRYSSVYYDGTSHTLQNTKQSDYLGEQIEKLIEIYRSVYFIPYNMDIRVTSVSKSYDDNAFLIAKTIEAEIVMFDEWEINLLDPSSTIAMIHNINLNVAWV